ncbi:hypothetical protein OJAV_G00129540 [Oryzias javanicus]|uniref:RIIa domain-containing protein n=1 Tax=Oryzias javanicus TaxID=123683 RepID=A0A3S2MD63_ORYJA|nr:hypothetical protein OJAV_G00129540 [Oryzias javanicus]
MSAQFFTAHLRVPRGLGAVIEGLAREVLRDQPENIPEYAANYFNALLQQREESGMDPAEWAAKLEDRYHHNNFELTDVAEKKSVPEMTRSVDGFEESQIKDESSAPLTEHIIASENSLLSQSSDEDEESDVQSDDLSGTNEDDHVTLNSPDAETENTDLKLTRLSLMETSNVELVERRDDLQRSPLPPNPLLDLEEEEVTADSVENPLNSGLADVDVDVAEPHGTEESFESDMNVSEEDKSVKPQLEVADEELFLPQNEIVQGNQEEPQQAQSDAVAPDNLNQMDIPKEEPWAESSSDEPVVPVGMEESDGKTSAENKQMNMLESQQKEELTEPLDSLADQNTSDAEDESKPEMKQTEREVDSEGEQTENQSLAFEIMKENMDRNNSDLNDSDDGEKDKGVKSIRASDQPTTEAENDIRVDEADRKDEEEMREGQDEQSQETENETHPRSKEDEGTDAGDGEEEETQGKGEVEVKDGEVDLDPSQLTQLNGSMAGMAAESETCEESGRLSPQEKSQNALIESQREDTLEEVTPQEKTATSNLLMTESYEGERSTEADKDPSEPISHKVIYFSFVPNKCI